MTYSIKQEIIQKLPGIFLQWGYKFMANFWTIEIIYFLNQKYWHINFTDVLNDLASSIAYIFAGVYAVIFFITDLVKDWTTNTIKSQSDYRDDLFNRLIEPLIVIGVILFSYLVFSKPSEIIGQYGVICFLFLLDISIVFVSLFFKDDFNQ